MNNHYNQEKSTIDPIEIEKFSKIADEWWDKNGKFKPLHLFNPARINYIKNYLQKYFNLQSNTNSEKIFTNYRDNQALKIIDIGCGGGLVAEPLALMGAEITAIDASDKNIAVAKIHSEKTGVEINYLKASSEEYLKQFPQQKFSVVLALEVIEHVANIEKLISDCATLGESGSLIFIATINRNIKSLLTAKFIAEYVLRWLPIGTHDWQKFLKPSEINEIANNYQLELKEICGFEYSIIKNQWQQNYKNIDVNYIMVFEKK